MSEEQKALACVCGHDKADHRGGDADCREEGSNGVKCECTFFEAAQPDTSPGAPSPSEEVLRNAFERGRSVDPDDLRDALQKTFPALVPGDISSLVDALQKTTIEDDHYDGLGGTAGNLHFAKQQVLDAFSALQTERDHAIGLLDQMAPYKTELEGQLSRLREALETIRDGSGDDWVYNTASRFLAPPGPVSPEGQ